MKISKLSYISKNFEKKRLLCRKKVVNLRHQTNNKEITNLKSTTMNTTQMKGYYSQASKLASKIYNLFMETFADIPCVVYCVGTDRWQDHVNIEVWATIGNGYASDDLRELVGHFSKTFSFASYRTEKAADFFERIKNEIQPFARKAKNVQEIVNNEK